MRTSYFKHLKDTPLSNFTLFQFSGHGVTVVGKPKGRTFNESNYIVWDGKQIRQYQPTKWHDCMVMRDLHLVSLQRVRYNWIANGVEPVILFPCQIGESSIEIKNPEKNRINGLATYCWTKNITKTITLRNFITQSNLLSEKMGFDQFGEVLCSKELIDCKLFEPEYTLKPICVYMVDMCRVYGKKEEYIVDNDTFAP